MKEKKCTRCSKQHKSKAASSKCYKKFKKGSNQPLTTNKKQQNVAEIKQQDKQIIIFDRKQERTQYYRFYNDYRTHGVRDGEKQYMPQERKSNVFIKKRKKAFILVQ